MDRKIENVVAVANMLYINLFSRRQGCVNALMKVKITLGLFVFNNVYFHSSSLDV